MTITRPRLSSAVSSAGLALIFLVVIIAARCRRIASRPLRRDYAAIFPRPELLAAAVIAMLISATLYQVLHFRHLWALLGVVAAVDRVGPGRRTATAGTASRTGPPRIARRSDEAHRRPRGRVRTRRPDS